MTASPKTAHRHGTRSLPSTKSVSGYPQMGAISQNKTKKLKIIVTASRTAGKALLPANRAQHDAHFNRAGDLVAGFFPALDIPTPTLQIHV
jgi:hypothetical protein